MGKYLDKQGVETLWNKAKELNAQKQDRTSADLTTKAKGIVEAINEAADAAKAAQSRADEVAEVAAKTDGYYAGMRVGTADNLTARGDATEEEFTRRKAGGDNAIEEGYATIKAVRGNSIVINNNIKVATALATYGDAVIQDGGSLIYTITKKGGVEIYENHNMVSWIIGSLIQGNKLLIYARIKAPYNSSKRGFISGYSSEALKSFSSVYYDTVAGEWSLCVGIVSIPKNGTYDFRVGFPTLAESSVGDQFYVKDVQCVNLTQMFGAGNEPASPEEFAARLGYESVSDIPYIPYNEGQIVDMTATGIRTTGTDDGAAWTQERSWKPVLDKYFGGHLCSVGNVRDEITANKAVNRVCRLIIDDNFMIAEVDLNDKSFRIRYIVKTKSSNSYKGTASAPFTYKYDGGYYYDEWVIGFASPNQLWLCVPSTTAKSTEEWKNYLKKNPITLLYPIASEVYDIDEQNLTERVSPDGTEEIITPESDDVTTSAPLVADIVYPIDSYNTIKANKANIGSVSSLATSDKSDLVAAINELVGRVAALEAKSTETTSTTEEQ